ncbi:MAG TPA: hypothetical protein VN838_05640 [Bradyrhizobium sp.]|nr:hypothetical protein [Bradyrhizobium sp.]
MRVRPPESEFGDISAAGYKAGRDGTVQGYCPYAPADTRFTTWMLAWVLGTHERAVGAGDERISIERTK